MPFKIDKARDQGMFFFDLNVNYMILRCARKRERRHAGSQPAACKKEVDLNGWEKISDSYQPVLQGQTALPWKPANGPPF